MNSQKHRIVITGGPGTGKSTLIDQLQREGFFCFQEISRQVTQEAREAGIAHIFKSDPLAFSRKLLEARLEQYRAAQQVQSRFLFYDRGLPDVNAYLHFAQIGVPESFEKTVELHQYDLIFLLPVWESIYQTDNERYENLEEALSIENALTNYYQQLGYVPILLPKTTVGERISIIKSHLNIQLNAE